MNSVLSASADDLEEPVRLRVAGRGAWVLLLTLLASLSIVAGARPAAAAPAPVAAYSFDEGSGSVLEDSVSANDGTISGASWVSGKYGSALDFDGVDDLVTIADASELDLTTTFTIEAWVRPETLAAWKTVVGKATSSGGNSGYLLNARGPFAGPGANAATGGTNKGVNSVVALPTGVWTHIAVTNDATTLRLYVDGDLEASAPAGPAQAITAPLVLGHNQLFNTYFDGQIDEVRLYDQALSEGEVEEDLAERVKPELHGFTTSVLDTGASSELVSSIPVTKPADPAQERVVYSLPVASPEANEILRVTGNMTATNQNAYGIEVSVRLVLGASPSDTAGTLVLPRATTGQTSAMRHRTLPLAGAYRFREAPGSRYLKMVVGAQSASASPGDIVSVQPNYGRLAATRYTPITTPTSAPTHLVQPHLNPLGQALGALPVDSVWRVVQSRKLTDLEIDDLLDVSGQVGIENTTGGAVELESKIVLATHPSHTTGPWASSPIVQRLDMTTSAARFVHGYERTVAEPERKYVNLAVRALPVGGSSPATVTEASASLDVLRLKPEAGLPTAPLRAGTRQTNPYVDSTPNVSSLPFAHHSAPERRVVASVPLYGLRKGDVVRGRGFITGDLAGANDAQLVAGLIMADSPTSTDGAAVAKLSGDSMTTVAPVHTVVKDGTYLMPSTSYEAKHLNLVAYASRAPAFPGESMPISRALVTYSRSMRADPFSADFEDGLLDQFYEFDFNGDASVSTEQARTGVRALRIDVDSTDSEPDDPPGTRRVEIHPPDMRTAGGYDGEETWHGFSAYFPDDFAVPGPDPFSYFEGAIDEVRFYDEALTDSQIEADRDADYSGSPSPVAAFSFNEGAGPVAHDSAGSHDGTLEGATWLPSGRHGAALAFDGVDDLVRVAHSSDLDLGAEFTVEAWIRPDVSEWWAPVAGKAENPASPTGYLLNAGAFSRPGGFAANAGVTESVLGSAPLPTTAWSHVAVTSDGTTMRLYEDGDLAATASAVTPGATTADLTIGGGPLNPAKAGTWNIFAQWHHADTGLDCTTDLSPPINFGVRHYQAGAHTNPGASQTATPTTGDYIEVTFRGGQLNGSCDDTIDPAATYVIAPLTRDQWYDFVLHTRWTHDASGATPVSEVWVDGIQVLGALTTPVLVPNLFWHGTPTIRNTTANWQFGMYRGPSVEDPPTRLYIDAMRRGNSYEDVAPGR